MSKNSDSVKLWRERTKANLIRALGGKCVCCGYARCTAALELHHLDPTQKDFNISAILSDIRSWDRLMGEAKKCVLICSNCHRELHRGLTVLPAYVPEFNLAACIAARPAPELSPCPVCNKLKPAYNITCSKQCAARHRSKVAWDTLDLVDLVAKSSIVRVAESLGVSDMAVRKHLKQLAGSRVGSRRRPVKP